MCIRTHCTFIKLHSIGINLKAPGRIQLPSSLYTVHTHTHTQTLAMMICTKHAHLTDTKNVWSCTSVLNTGGAVIRHPVGVDMTGSLALEDTNAALVLWHCFNSQLFVLLPKTGPMHKATNFFFWHQRIMKFCTKGLA